MLIKELADSSVAFHRENGVPIHVYVSLLSFKDVEDSGLFDRLNTIQTTLELSDEEVDLLISSGRKLLQEDEEFQNFLQAIEQLSGE